MEPNYHLQLQVSRRLGKAITTHWHPLTSSRLWKRQPTAQPLHSQKLHQGFGPRFSTTLELGEPVKFGAFLGDESRPSLEREIASNHVYGHGFMRVNTAQTKVKLPNCVLFRAPRWRFGVTGVHVFERQSSENYKSCVGRAAQF